MKSHKESPAQWIISSLWLILNTKVVWAFQQRIWTHNSIPPSICLELNCILMIWQFTRTKNQLLGIDFDKQVLESAISVYHLDPATTTRTVHFKMGSTLQHTFNVFFTIMKNLTSLYTLGTTEGGRFLKSTCNLNLQISTQLFWNFSSKCSHPVQRRNVYLYRMGPVCFLPQKSQSILNKARLFDNPFLQLIMTVIPQHNTVRHFVGLCSVLVALHCRWNSKKVNQVVPYLFQFKLHHIFIKLNPKIKLVKPKSIAKYDPNVWLSSR